jgi:hypothetical protein
LKTVTLYIDASRTIEIVRELRQQGMVQGQDFDFEYNREDYDQDNISVKPHVNFIFYKEKYATFFALKYSI